MTLRLGQWHTSLTIVFVILGFLLATAFSTQQRWGERQGPRKQNLIEFIKRQRDERDRLGRQIVGIRRDVESVESRNSGSSGMLASYRRDLEGLKARSGLTVVGGPGLEVVLGDAKRVPSGVDPDSFLIHDFDLQIIVNALWRGGARALAINGERFVAGTGIRSAGSAILINSKPQGGPYRIRALGDPRKLLKTLKADADASLLLGDYAQKYGLTVKTAAKKKMELPPFIGSLRLTTLGGE